MFRPYTRRSRPNRALSVALRRLAWFDGTGAGTTGYHGNLPALCRRRWNCLTSIGTFGTYARARAHGSRVRRPSPIRVLTRQTADAQREPRVTLPVRRAGRHRPEGLAPIPRPTSAGRRCVQPGGTFGAHAPQRAVVVDRDDQWDRRIRTRPRPEADDRSRLGERSRPRPSLWLDRVD
jgi:hypothetical protein